MSVSSFVGTTPMKPFLLARVEHWWPSSLSSLHTLLTHTGQGHSCVTTACIPPQGNLLFFMTSAQPSCQTRKGALQMPRGLLWGNNTKHKICHRDYFMCTVQWHLSTFNCGANIITTQPQNTSSCKTETLPHSTGTPHVPPPPHSPWQLPFYVCLCDPDYSGCLI